MAEEKNVTVSETKAAKKAEPAKKDSKKSLGVKFSNWIRGYKSTLKKIVWYNREQTFKSSLIVIVSILIVSAVIGGLDWCFSKLLIWLGTLV